jgi:hypothetical protein
MSVAGIEGKIENSETEMSNLKDISECGQVSDQMSEAELSSGDTSEQGKMDNQQMSDDQMSESELTNKSLIPSNVFSKTRQLDNEQMTNDELSDAELSYKSIFPSKVFSETRQLDIEQMTNDKLSDAELSEYELSNKMSDDKVSHTKMSLDQNSRMSYPDIFNKNNSKPDRLSEYELSNKDNSKPDDSTKLKVIPQIGHIISPSGEEEEATFDNDDTSSNRPFNSKSTQQKLQKNSATINDISNQEEFTKFGKRKSVAKMQHSS